MHDLQTIVKMNTENKSVPVTEYVSRPAYVTVFDDTPEQKKLKERMKLETRCFCGN